MPLSKRSYDNRIVSTELPRADQDSSSDFMLSDMHGIFFRTMPDRTIFVLISTAVVRKCNTNALQHMTSLPIFYSVVREFS